MGIEPSAIKSTCRRAKTAGLRVGDYGTFTIDCYRDGTRENLPYQVGTTGINTNGA